MRKRLVFILGMAICALILPAAVSAHPLSTDVTASGSTAYYVLRNSCTNSGGANGWGKSIMQIEQDEYGKSGVAQFRVTAWAQEKYGGSWHTIYSFGWTYSTYFGNTSGDHYFIYKFVYSWSSDHQVYYERLKWRGEWLSSGGSALYYQNLNGRAC